MNEGYLAELREQLVGGCSTCNGRGYSVQVGTSRVIPCKCLMRFRVVARLHEGGVPRSYHSVKSDDYRYKSQNFESFRRVKSFMENLRKNVKAGSGIYFAGRPGVGKTFLMCCILREAARLDLSVCYRSLGALLAELAAGDFAGESTKRFFESDVLAIDEVEKVYKTKSGVSEVLFDRLIRHRYGENRSVLVASNCPRGKLESVHGSAIVSLFSGMLEDVPLMGEDYRPRMLR